MLHSKSHMKIHLNKTPIQILLLLLWCGNVLAESHSPCRDLLGPLLLDQPAPLQRTVGKAVAEGAVLDLPTLQRAAIQLNGTTKPPALSEGIYVYLITEGDQLTLLPRTLTNSSGKPFSKTGNLLGTHEGLFQLLAKNGTPKILGAGEIAVRDGNIRTFSNRSGTFRGDANHLQYSLQIFKANQLPFKSRLVQLEYGAGAANPHRSALSQASLDALFQSDPALAKLLAQTRKTLNAIPDEKIDELASLLMDKSLSIKAPVEARYYEYGFHLLASWPAPLESDAAIIRPFIGKLKYENYPALLQIIERESLQK